MPWKSLNQAFADESTDTIYFLSDGKPNKDHQSGSWSSSDFDNVANHYVSLNASRVESGSKSIKINSTSVGLDSEWMQLLSSRTTGEYIKVDDI